jgi:phosphoglycolate phosphatase-like HAD superfamily hydrolase
MFVIFDLDGTLADCEHRQHHVRAFDLDGGEPGAVDWDAFYRACVHDKPIRHAINTMAALRNAGAAVEIWTGRSDLVLGETIDWLARHGVPRVGIRMRPHGDHQPDHKLKGFWLRHAATRPDLVFEDRARVVAMWRAEGIPCYQVAPGEF